MVQKHSLVYIYNRTLAKKKYVKTEHKYRTVSHRGSTYFTSEIGLYKLSLEPIWYTYFFQYTWQAYMASDSLVSFIGDGGNNGEGPKIWGSYKIFEDQK